MKKLSRTELATLELLLKRAQATEPTLPIFNLLGQEVKPSVVDSVSPAITPNKYNRTIKDIDGNSVVVDVYAVLEAFQVTCPALQHLVKKALCAGLRGHKDVTQDLKDIKDSAFRAIQLNNNRLPKVE